MEGYPEITKDNWNGGIQIETQPNTDGYTEYMRSYKPFEMPYINIMGAKDAYDYVLKCSHAFNLMDARGIISATDRAGFLGRIRKMARTIAKTFVAEREALGFPLLKEK